MTIIVNRGPNTGKDYNRNGWDISVSQSDTAVYITFHLGTQTRCSDISVNIEADSFKELIRAMMLTNRNATLKAIGSALLQG